MDQNNTFTDYYYFEKTINARKSFYSDFFRANKDEKVTFFALARKFSNKYFLTHAAKFYKQYNETKSWIDYIKWKIPSFLKRHHIKVFYYTPMFILTYLFIYDCYYNDFILNKVFWLLPFYAIFIVWYRISLVFRRRYLFIERYLFDKMYCYPYIQFEPLDKEELDHLVNYMKSWFVHLDTSTDFGIFSGTFKCTDSIEAKRYVCVRGFYTNTHEYNYVLLNQNIPAIMCFTKDEKSCRERKFDQYML